MSGSQANRILAHVAGCLLLLARSSQAAWESKVVVGDLDQPSAVATHPDTDHVFVAESGRGRILRITNGVASEVITELAVDPEASPARGPRGLLFLDAQTLVVAGMCAAEQPTALLLFRLPPAGSPPLTVRDAVRIEAASDTTPPPREDVGSLLLTRGGILAGTSGPNGQGWILRAETKPTEDKKAVPELGVLQRFLDVGKATGVAGPVCLAVSPRGELVVGQAGQPGEGQETRGTLFRASDQKRLLSLPAGLQDLVGLCYSSAQSTAAAPLLYAIERGTGQPEQAGLYRLDAAFRKGTQAIQATRVLALDRPSSITSGPDQGFFVTTLGGDNSEAGKSGRLLQLSWKP